MRVIGVVRPVGMQALPGVPTIAEQGFPGFRAETWNGIAAPAGTPDAVVARLAAALGSACADAAFRAGLEHLGTLPVCSTPADVRQAMASDAPQWAELVRVPGIRLE